MEPEYWPEDDSGPLPPTRGTAGIGTVIAVLLTLLVASGVLGMCAPAVH